MDQGTVTTCEDAWTREGSVLHFHSHENKDNVGKEDMIEHRIPAHHCISPSGGVEIQSQSHFHIDRQKHTPTCRGKGSIGLMRPNPIHLG